MLNYIWLALILVGITVAVWSDVHDLTADKYHNNREESVAVQFVASGGSLQPKVSYPCSVTLISSEISGPQRAELIPTSATSGLLRISINDKASILWRERVKVQKSSEVLSSTVRWESISGNSLTGAVAKFEPVKFVKLNAVTNDGFIKYAKTAVELAIGLIGIMALWLGVMKIAEQSGLVAKLAALLKPVTSRLFPDVPPDHPAMGAMVMNISANMLGLANAATPLGLKAMEELNKLSKKVGTATDAMCTFLVINTSSVQLIPATVIAIRAASGSTNPTEILGPVIVATTVNTLVGIMTVRLLSKLPIFKRQLETGGKND
jgi:spore maturation protein A